MMNHNGGPDRAAGSLLRRQLTGAKRIEVVLKPTYAATAMPHLRAAIAMWESKKPDARDNACALPETVKDSRTHRSALPPPISDRIIAARGAGIGKVTARRCMGDERARSAQND